MNSCILLLFHTYNYRSPANHWTSAISDMSCGQAMFETGQAMCGTGQDMSKAGWDMSTTGRGVSRTGQGVLHVLCYCSVSVYRWRNSSSHIHLVEEHHQLLILEQVDIFLVLENRKYSDRESGEKWYMFYSDGERHDKSAQLFKHLSACFWRVLLWSFKCIWAIKQKWTSTAVCVWR